MELKTAFCFGCQKIRKEAEMHTVQRGKMKRKMCTLCIERRNESPYSTKTREQREAE